MFLLNKIMNVRKILFTAMFLSIAGILFAGYMTLQKFISGTCSFGEACPFLWGYPVCLYGLIIFFMLFLATLKLLLDSNDKLAKHIFKYISILGIIYSGYYAYQDIFHPLCRDNCVYQLGLPTCVYGFIVFLAVFVCMILYRKK